MNYHLIQSSHPWLILPASAGHEVRNMLLQEHTGACYSPLHSASKRSYSQKSVLPSRIALACPKCQPRYPPTQKNHLNSTTSLSLPNAPYWLLPCDSTALEAVWCQLSAQASALEGKPKELVLSEGYDKILLSIPPGLLPPTAQPWLRKSSNTEKCLHATYTLLPCISGGDPGCPVNSPCK